MKIKKNILKLYPEYHSLEFVRRENRFVVILKDKNEQLVKAYLPNPGRMEEYLIPGLTYYVVKTTTKIPLKVVSVKYKGEYVLLEPAKANDIFACFLDKQMERDKSVRGYKREVKFNNSRFDFLIDMGNEKIIAEVKSCTRFANKLAMFPDAPSKRALKHLNNLSDLAGEKRKVKMVYMVFSSAVKCFVPDYHTDFEYALEFAATSKINKDIYCVKMLNPVSVDLESFRKVSVNKKLLKRDLSDKGSYLVVLKNDRDVKIKTGALGELIYKQGFYVYVGSAMNSLSKRVGRLSNKRRKKHWHIDYITPLMTVFKKFLVRSMLRLEEVIVKDITVMADSSVRGFGSSDTKLDSHLLYFKNNPLEKAEFFEIIMKYRTIGNQ